jgi:hypothetical protein
MASCDHPQLQHPGRARHQHQQRTEQGGEQQRHPKLEGAVHHQEPHPHPLAVLQDEDQDRDQEDHSPDMEGLAALGRAREQTMAEQAPHILGMTVAEHADRPGDFTETVYFTSEEHTRRFEREQPVEFDPSFAELSSLMPTCATSTCEIRGWTARASLRSEKGAVGLPGCSLQEIAAVTCATCGLHSVQPLMVRDYLE